MGITVENGGILTTVQDEGRFGNQAFGVSTSVPWIRVLSILPIFW